MDILPDLTIRELVNYGMPIWSEPETKADPYTAHTPTALERCENDSNEGWDDWHEHRQQVAERREVMLEGMV